MEVSFNWKPFELYAIDFRFNQIDTAWNLMELTLKGLAQMLDFSHLIIHTNAYSQH